MSEKRKTLRDYILKEGIEGRYFVDPNKDREKLNVSIGYSGIYTIIGFNESMVGATLLKIRDNNGLDGQFNLSHHLNDLEQSAQTQPKSTER